MTHVEIVIAVRTPDPAAFAAALEAEARRLAAEFGVEVVGVGP